MQAAWQNQNVPVQLGMCEGLLSQPIKKFSFYFLVFLLLLACREITALSTKGGYHLSCSGLAYNRVLIRAAQELLETSANQHAAA